MREQEVSMMGGREVTVSVIIAMFIIGCALGKGS